jgi:hypothetical protein
VFPYGSVHVVVVEGGLRASSGIAIAELGAATKSIVSDMRLKLLIWSSCCLQMLIWRHFQSCPESGTESCVPELDAHPCYLAAVQETAMTTGTLRSRP